MKDNGKIVKEQGKNGMIIYRYANADIEKEDLEKSSFENESLGWCISLIIEKFKIFLSFLNDNDYVQYGLILGSLIKEMEKEMDEMTEFISNSIGDISFLYHRDLRYMNYRDDKVVGLVFKPKEIK